MNKETESVFEILKYDVTKCHYYWILYRQLFGTNENRIHLINQTTPSFFAMFQDLFLDYITLELSKLTDPAEMGKYKNLTLYYLLDLLHSEISEEFHNSLKSVLDELSSLTEHFRNRRNKLVAHRDLSSVEQNEEYLFSRQKVEDALIVVRKYLNEIESHFYNKHTLYNEFIPLLNDDGTAMLINMAKSIAYDDLVKKEILQPRLWEKYSKVF